MKKFLRNGIENIVYTEEEKQGFLSEFRLWKGTARSYIQHKGLPQRTFYGWLKCSNGSEPKKEAVAVPISLEFNVVQEREAQEWVTSHRFGRFMELKENLLSQLRSLRKNQAITFQAPKEEKEIKSVHHSCYAAIKKAGLPFQMNYSKSKNLFVVLHKKVSEVEG